MQMADEYCSEDVGNNKTANDLRQLRDFVIKNSHTNVIQMCVPHRFDLHVNFCGSF
jgi:hypothetical protein